MKRASWGMALYISMFFGTMLETILTDKWVLKLAGIGIMASLIYLVMGTEEFAGWMSHIREKEREEST